MNFIYAFCFSWLSLIQLRQGKVRDTALLLTGGGRSSGLPFGFTDTWEEEGSKLPLDGVGILAFHVVSTDAIVRVVCYHGWWLKFWPVLSLLWHHPGSKGRGTCQVEVRLYWYCWRGRKRVGEKAHNFLVCRPQPLFLHYLGDSIRGTSW